MMPMAVRSVPERIEDVQLDNQFVVIQVPIPLVADLETSLQTFKSILSQMKNSLEPVLTLLYAKVAFTITPYSDMIAKILTKK